MSFTFILIQAGTACCQTFSVPQALRRNGWRAAVPFWGRGKARRTGPFQRKRRFPGGQGRNAMAGQGGNIGERGMPRRKSRAERAKVRGTCGAGEKPHALMRKAERQAAEPASGPDAKPCRAVARGCGSAQSRRAHGGRPQSRRARQWKVCPGGQGRNAMAGQGGNTGERGRPRRKSRVERARGARKMLCLLRAFRRAGGAQPSAVRESSGRRCAERAVPVKSPMP